MKRPRALPLVLVLATLPVAAGELTKPYFGATAPGTWTRYAMEAEKVDPYSYTYRRLPDVDGKARIEISVVFTGQMAGSWSKSVYTLAKGFDPARDMLSHAKFLDAVVLEAKGMGAMPQPAETVKAIRDGSSDYRKGMTFVGTEQLDGRTCDRYSYSAPSLGALPTVEVGEVWLDASLPFGIVKQAATLKDAKSGEVRSRYVMRLVGSGVGEPPEGGAVGVASKGDAPTGGDAASKPGRDAGSGTSQAGRAGGSAPSLLEAFQAGKVKLEIAVSDGGRQLHVTARNRTTTPMEVRVGAGRIVFAQALALTDLVMLVDDGVTLKLPGGGTAAFDAGQGGDKGAVRGNFELTFDDGATSFGGQLNVEALPPPE